MTMGSKLGPVSRATALIVALGLGPVLAGCADIHPEPNDPGGGILDSPTDEAERFREESEREAEHGREQQEHRN